VDVAILEPTYVDRGRPSVDRIVGTARDLVRRSDFGQWLLKVQGVLVLIRDVGREAAETARRSEKAL
jgi:hypothetical protein